MSQFDQVAANWDDKPQRTKLAKAIAECIKSSVPLLKNMEVMDFGCGTGLVTMELANQVKSVSAFDNSKGMLDVLKHKMKTSGVTNIYPHLIDLHGDICEDKKYDLIFSSMVLHHIEDYEAVLNCFYHLLESNGMIAISDLYEEDGSFHSPDLEIPHKGFDVAYFKSILEKTGFEEIRDQEAYCIPRIQDNGSERKYPVFLITAKKNTSYAY